MGAWISFKYPMSDGKEIGHTAHIQSAADLQDILDRYMLDPRSLSEIKVNDKPVGVEAIVKKLSA